MLFGAIADSEKAVSSSRPVQAGRHEQHNTLPLYSQSQSRFPLLPVVEESSRANQHLQKLVSQVSERVCTKYKREGGDRGSERVGK